MSTIVTETQGVTLPAGPRTPVPDPAGHALEALSEIQQLWLDYKATPTPSGRERLILHYAPLVSAIAGRVGMRLPNTVESADLVSYGMFGLIDAIDKFDPSRDIKFETYASTRIRGAIIDELRALDWIPRSVRSRAREYDRACQHLENTLHREPTNAEIAGHMGVKEKDIWQLQWQVSSGNVIALDEVVATGDRVDQISAMESVQRTMTDDPAQSFAQVEMREILGSAVDQLNERERAVVTLYYFKSMTLSEIGRLLGVTESRVSQMHSAILLKLRKQLIAVEAD
ncbi:FliA/WhiG family RNA polymerase sigma factor [Jonesia quinghaiensis]|uniref:FliA/WhiG family RNA polymerase sigma factor n=1 Tax=Jonesia quinghaiensis TaxID=262806 RepID=UPI0004255C48|nr:FliA/WhiG family RNA polymerase sigma factor [Jonesia quinghaiensis]